jgi:hypothetical protein
MINEENYLNTIELLKQALLFYANEENYLFYKNRDAPVAIDNGHQARFVLKTINELDKINKKIESDYDEIINNVEKEETPENIINIINKIKEINDTD